MEEEKNLIKKELVKVNDTISLQTVYKIIENEKEDFGVILVHAHPMFGGEKKILKFISLFH